MKQIRRYSNRKLYDVDASHYVTLRQLGDIVRSGEEIKVQDKDSGRDITVVTLAQILFERARLGLGTVDPQDFYRLIRAGS